jgi:type II secretory pathway pseudopilin PulG
MGIKMKQRGFTMIETLLALSLLIIFISVIAYSYSIYKRNVRAKKVFVNVTRIASAIESLSEGRLKHNLNLSAVSSYRSFPKTVAFSKVDGSGVDPDGNIYSFGGVDNTIRASFPHLSASYSAYHVYLLLNDTDLCHSIIENAVPVFDLISTNLGVVKDDAGNFTLDNRCTNNGATSIYFINY